MMVVDPIRRRVTVGSMAAALTAAFTATIAAPASAQEGWPSKPITYIVPFAPGGTTDVLGRLIGQRLGTVLKTPIVVENKPGAGGNVGSDIASKAPADGYTFVGGTISSHSINVSLYPKMPYDPVKSFAPVTLIGTLPNVLVVNNDSPFRSVQDLIAAAKAKPNSILFGSSGSGTSQHLAGELFKTMAGVEMVHVPYKGGGPALQDLLGGQITLLFENAVAARPLVEAGKLRALAVTSLERATGMGDIPTLSESGLKGYEIVSWQAIFAPAGTPQPIVDRVATEVGRMIRDPEFRARLVSLGVEPSGAGPAELAAFQQSEVAKWARLIKTANIRLE
jgi:tripartite-type tricarboxylate transporter receptor subunit TctC